nr:hypothetical protein [Gymnodinialimonas phycosphaerae]
MSSHAWTDTENDLIVADYFAMLADDVAGRPHNKAEHRRQLLPRLNNRSDGAVEFKRQNISAVLKGLGEAWITGYNPVFNFQASLIDAVARWLAMNPDWTHRTAPHPHFTARGRHGGFGPTLGRARTDSVQPAAAGRARADAPHRPEVRRGCAR